MAQGQDCCCPCTLVLDFITNIPTQSQKIKIPPCPHFSRAVCWRCDSAILTKVYSNFHSLIYQRLKGIVKHFLKISFFCFHAEFKPYKNRNVQSSICGFRKGYVWDYFLAQGHPTVLSGCQETSGDSRKLLASCFPLFPVFMLC